MLFSRLTSSEKKDILTNPEYLSLSVAYTYTCPDAPERLKHLHTCTNRRVCVSVYICLLCICTQTTQQVASTWTSLSVSLETVVISTAMEKQCLCTVSARVDKGLFCAHSQTDFLKTSLHAQILQIIL